MVSCFSSSIRQGLSDTNFKEKFSEIELRTYSGAYRNIWVK